MDCSETTPIAAICYDFDKTLSPLNMQEQGFIQACGMDALGFWGESNRLALENRMDPNLAYLWLMIRKAAGRFPLTEERLARFGSGVTFFPGVSTWFGRIDAFGKEHGLSVEHYVISSGLREMIMGSAIASCFTAVFASSYCYGSDGIACWPAQVVNYTNKTQYLFRIEKGILDVNSDKVNEYMPDEKVRVPFRNMVYIGDSDTDIPCMTVVKARGGYSIGVSQEKGDRLLKEGRIQFSVSADYREGGSLDQLVREIILKTEAQERILRRLRK
jgi:hypothetical protein